MLKPSERFPVGSYVQFPERSEGGLWSNPWRLSMRYWKWMGPMALRAAEPPFYLIRYVGNS